MIKFIKKYINTYSDWIIIIVFIIFVVFGLLRPGSLYFKISYPALSFIAGLLLYFLKPFRYISFILWIWVLNPCIRRVVDFQLEWDHLNTVILTPYLVLSPTLITFIHRLGYLSKKTLLAFIMIFISIGYGYILGVVNNGMFSASFELLTWILPVFFGIHIILQFKTYNHCKAIIQKTFIWIILVIGTYGLLQFIFLFDWDKYWMISSQMKAIGGAESFKVRVFSTLNSPNVFARVMLVGLLLLFNNRGAVAATSATFGYIAFLLSMVRSAWGGWMLGVSFAILRAKKRFKIHIFLVIIVVCILLMPFLFFTPINEQMSSRFQSISNIKDDISLKKRIHEYVVFLPQSLFNLKGQGFGGIGLLARINQSKYKYMRLHSEIIYLPYSLGFFAGLTYIIALFGLLSNTFQTSLAKKDQFTIINETIIVAIFSQAIFSRVLVSMPGLMLWMFLGLALARKKYFCLKVD
tara:strand:+ start:564 stop:1958 length:1395 start_codon:yes stop_codon:yes gene_type:complete